MGKMYWKCSCGWTVDEPAAEQGHFQRKYLDRASHHEAEHKESGEDEAILGLFETQEDGDDKLLTKGKNFVAAIQAGYLPRSKHSRKKENGETGESGGNGKTQPLVQGEFAPVRIVLPNVIMQYFEEARVSFPEAYPDRSAETISAWLTEVVMGFYTQWTILAMQAGDEDNVPLMGKLTVMAQAMPEIQRQMAAEKEAEVSGHQK